MTRPNIQIPKEFAINGEKNDFTSEKIQSGFDNLNPDVLAGDNLNKLIDDTYKGINGVLDLYNGIVLHEMTTTYDNKAVVGKFIDDNFKLYRSLQNENLGHDVTETEYWEELKLGGGGSGFQMFDTVLKDHVLTFEKSKGLALQGTYVYKTGVSGSRYGYPDFYNKCLEEKSDGLETEMQLEGSTITVYKNTNGHIFYDIADKDAVDLYFLHNGICWMYGIDTENERIFLPRKKIMDVTSSDIPVVGTSHALTLIGSDNTPMSIMRDCGDNYYAVAKSNTVGAVGTKGQRWTSGAGGILGVSQDPALSGLKATLSEKTDVYLYMVVGNTEVTSSITDVTEVTTSENDTIPLFTAQYFDFTPNNPSWLKAGTQKNSGGIYTTAYNTLVNCLTDNTYNIKVIDTANMTSGVDYSEYWKVDQTNMTFTTPISVSNKPLTGAVVGNGMTLGLTDGQNNRGLMTYNGDVYTRIALGANEDYYGTEAGTTTNKPNTYTNKTYGVTTDPTKSGIIAEESTTAQLYFKVANAVQNLELLNAAEVMEAVNNVVPDNSSLISSYAMPSGKYIELTLGASGTTYKAPANGWFSIRKLSAGTNQYVQLFNSSNGMALEVRGPANGTLCACYMPVRSGDVVTCTYSASGSTQLFRFIYAEGEV